jgi:hypothetical protein
VKNVLLVNALLTILFKPRHNYRYVCAELMRLYYRGYEFAL